MNFNNIDGAYRGSYGETDGFLVLMLVSLCSLLFCLVNLYFDTPVLFFWFLRDLRREANITAMGLARRRNLAWIVTECYK